MKSKIHDEECVFCREQLGRNDTNFSKIYPNLSSRYIFESNKLSIFPCIGQLTPKHSLIITKNHFNTFAQASTEVRDIISDAYELISQFNKAYLTEEEHLLMFEHGAICKKNGGCGIYHAHIHLVPIQKKLDLNCLYKFSNQTPRSFTHTYENLDENSSYLTCGYFKDMFMSQKLERALPSQYLRRNLAKEINVKHWDWREYNEQSSFHQMILSAESL